MPNTPLEGERQQHCDGGDRADAGQHADQGRGASIRSRPDGWRDAKHAARERKRGSDGSALAANLFNNGENSSQSDAGR
jgi:hypothetical protein